MQWGKMFKIKEINECREKAVLYLQRKKNIKKWDCKYLAEVFLRCCYEKEKRIKMFFWYLMSRTGNCVAIGKLSHYYLGFDKDTEKFYETICSCARLNSKAKDKYKDLCQMVLIDKNRMETEREQLNALIKQTNCQKRDVQEKIAYYVNDVNEKIETFLEQIQLYEKEQIYRQALQLEDVFISGVYSFVKTGYGVCPKHFTESEIALLNKFPQMDALQALRLAYFIENSKNRVKHMSRMASVYIKKYGIMTKINDLITKNPVLSNSKSSLLKTMAFYNQDKYVFCMLAVSQIEGLFMEYALNLGFSEKQLLTKTVSDKAALLEKKDIITSLDLMYYVFYFPIFRNRLMHGVIMNEDVSLYAELVLIDFFNVLDMASSDKFVAHKFEQLLRENEQGYDFEKHTELYLSASYFDKTVITDHNTRYQQLKDCYWSNYSKDLDVKCDDGTIDQKFKSVASIVVKKDRQLGGKMFRVINANATHT